MHLLSADMAMARSTAMMRRVAVVVCPRGAATGCSDVTGLEPRLDGVRRSATATAGPMPAATCSAFRRARLATCFTCASTRPFLRYQADGRSAHSNLTRAGLRRTTRLRGKVIVNNLGRVRSVRPGTPKPVPETVEPRRHAFDAISP